MALERTSASQITAILYSLPDGFVALDERWQFTYMNPVAQQIWQLRGTGEKTVRAQSASIYAKAGLAGRSELSAFFLEDLLVPPGSD